MTQLFYKLGAFLFLEHCSCAHSLFAK